MSIRSDYASMNYGKRGFMRKFKTISIRVIGICSVIGAIIFVLYALDRSCSTFRGEQQEWYGVRVEKCYTQITYDLNKKPIARYFVDTDAGTFEIADNAANKANLLHFWERAESFYNKIELAYPTAKFNFVTVKSRYIDKPIPYILKFVPIPEGSPAYTQKMFSKDVR